jgi:hypothetical protein
MQYVHFSCQKTWIETKISDLVDSAIQSKVFAIDLDFIKCDICKAKLSNRHQSSSNENTETK